MKDRLDKIKDVAHIVATIAVPVIIATLGWKIQDDLSDRQIQRDYVQMAITVLASGQATTDLKSWANKVLEKHSPVPMKDKNHWAEMSIVFNKVSERDRGSLQRLNCLLRQTIEDNKKKSDPLGDDAKASSRRDTPKFESLNCPERVD